MTGFLDWITALWSRVWYGERYCERGHDEDDHARLGRCEP